MHILLSKRLILLILSIILLLVIAVLTYFLYFQKPAELKNSEIVTEGVQKQLEINGKYFNKTLVNEALDRINNESLSDEQRYEALKDLSFYFSTAYAASHKPELRAYTESIETFTRENFPKFYEEGLFIIGCADPSCGEKPDGEIKQIQKEINEAGIAFEYLNTINKNLEQAIYIPNEQIEDKKYGFGLAIYQLKFENNPKASAAAEHLTDYVKRKYSIEFTEVKNEKLDKL